MGYQEVAQTIRVYRSIAQYKAQFFGADLSWIQIVLLAAQPILDGSAG